MKYTISPRALFTRDPMIYGQFLEHFHRQVYGGVFMPGHPLSDEKGFRTDVIEALRRIRVPIIRWPGGCFVSSYHWEKGVGSERVPSFDKAWRVEDPNTFGTDEFILLCRAIGCEPYICTNAGTGTEEEMSNWMEYCNLENEGEYAKRRIANGFTQPHKVKYWSIGNENYGFWEIGAKDADAWGKLVTEAAKMMKHVDPEAELSAAALTDINWNTKILSGAGKHLSWLSIHSYWDFMTEVHAPASYDACMAYTDDLEAPVRRVRGLLMAYGLEQKIRIAYDEWNLRSWHHPNIHAGTATNNKADYLTPRDKNDLNATYTMADAVFAACFLNMTLRNADIVGMANFSPVVNTRGMIYTHDKGIVLRSTYHVYDLYVNKMGDEVLDGFLECGSRMTVKGKDGAQVTVDAVDAVATRDSKSGVIAVAAVNKRRAKAETITLHLPIGGKPVTVTTLCGNGPDDYNDVDRNTVVPFENKEAVRRVTVRSAAITLPPHSVNIIRIG